MSKNITIKEGGTSRSFTADKLRTNLSLGGTCDWVPIDEVDQYVELEELHVTENGTYYPSEKVGISAVYVDVPQGGGGGGVPTGNVVQATALENLTAGDCVYIISGGSGGVASLVESSLTGVKTPTGSDGNYFYYLNSNNVYRIPLNNLMATPELTAYRASGIERYRMTQMDLGGYKSYCLITGIVINAAPQQDNQGSKSYYNLDFSQGSPAGIYDIKTGQMLVSGGFRQNVRMYNSNSYIILNSDNQYTIVTDGSSNVVNLDTAVNQNRIDVINNKLICYKNTRNSNNKYEVGYYDLNRNNGTFYNLYDKNGNKLEATDFGHIFYNIEDTILLVELINNGLALINNKFEVCVFTNISDSMLGVMVKNYYYDRTNGLIYFIPMSSVMGKTNDKNHQGSLGFVQADISQGRIANAIEMFR